MQWMILLINANVCRNMTDYSTRLCKW